LSTSHVSEYCDVESASFDPAHIHSDFEIYVNVSGDVSFLHGQSVYKVERGDVIFSYPGDVHYCIYHSSCVHDHFCLRFEAEADGAVERLLRESPIAGFVRPSSSVKEKIIDTLCSMCESDGEFDTLFSFFSILYLIKEWCGNATPSEPIPDRVSEILAYIDENLTTIKTSDEIASAFFISKPTLDRLFRQHVHISVHKLILAKRLSLAESLLKGGATVTEACYNAGFSDSSRFIAKFKEIFPTL
jgi:AraC-like DNA-binding protein